jgi:hypothetical protein
MKFYAIPTNASPFYKFIKVCQICGRMTEIWLDHVGLTSNACHHRKGIKLR